jgi:hypothetical protein
MILNFENLEFDSGTMKVPSEFIDRCPRYLFKFKFEYKTPLVKKNVIVDLAPLILQNFTYTYYTIIFLQKNVLNSLEEL